MGESDAQINSCGKITTTVRDVVFSSDFDSGEFLKKAHAVYRVRYGV